MLFTSLLRSPAALAVLNLAVLPGIAGGTYLLRSHIVELSEDHEARMPCLFTQRTKDELEDTLRGHVGLIEEALARLEGEETETDRGKKM